MGGVKSRVLAFIDYKGIKMKEFEAMADLSSGYVTSMRKGFGERKLNNVLIAFPELNRDWLLFGEGEMLKPSIEDPMQMSSSTISGRIVATDVESYDVALRAGVSLTPEYSSVFFGGRGTNTEGDYVVAHWHIPNAPKDAVIIPMLGNSMSPRFSSGSRLVVRPIEFFSPMSISFGDVFAIVVQDEYGYEPATHIKILRRHTDKSKEHTHWIARSINRDEYDDFEVEISRVSKLYKVVGGVDFFEMM